MKRIALALAALLTLVPGLACAQSVPSWISYGYVPSAGDQRGAWASKQDLLNYTPLSLSGGTMRGKLYTQAPTANGAGFSLLPGIAPTSPSNGDLWITPSGFFAQVNGQTLTFPNLSNVTITGGTINNTIIGNSNPVPGSFTTLNAASLTGLTTPLTAGQGGTGYTSLSAALDALLGNAQGTTAYRGSSGWVGLPPGSSGQVLTTGGAGANPSWGSASGGAYTPAPTSPTSNTTLATSDADRPFFPTGTITLTMPNGGAGWKTGTIRNANTTSGLVTLAIPSGATLDGATNGTTILFPYQRARIVQTGSTSYVTDWIDRTPIIQITSIASASAAANVQIVLPAGYGSFEVTVKELQPSSSTAVLQGRISFDGSTIASASNYNSYWIAGYANTAAQNGTAAAAYFNLIAGGVSVSSGYPAAIGKMLIYPGGGSLAASSGNLFTYSSDWVYVDNNPSWRKDLGYGAYTVNTARAQMMQFSFNTGNIASGQFTVRAMP